MQNSSRGLFLAVTFVLLAALAGSLLYAKERNARHVNYYRRQQEKLFSEYYVSLDYITGRFKEDSGEWQKTEYCNNRMVNALLYRKMQICRQRKIRTEIDLAQFEGGYVENTEWICLFFNLFDNAIEACSKVESGRERFIHVKAKCAGGFEVIVFQNSRNPAVLKGEQNRGISRRGQERGYGLHILKKIAEKYGGTVICKEEKEIFQTTVSLYIREKRQEKIL